MFFRFILGLIRSSESNNIDEEETGIADGSFEGGIVHTFGAFDCPFILKC